MEKSVSNAFIYMFKGSDRVYKLAIFTLLFAMPAIYVAFCVPDMANIKTMSQVQAIQMLTQLMIPTLILSIISFPLAFGYLSKCTHNVIINNEHTNVNLPSWEDDFLNYYTIGVKRCLGMLLICLVLLPASILLGIPILIYGFIIFALDNIFCTDFKINSYFKWGRAFKIVSSDYSLYVKVLTIAFVLGLLMFVVSSIFSVLKLSGPLSAFIHAACSAYSALVMAYLTGLIVENEEDQIPSGAYSVN